MVLRGRLGGIATAQADCNEGLSVDDTVDHTGRAIEGKQYSLTGTRFRGNDCYPPPIRDECPSNGYVQLIGLVRIERIVPSRRRPRPIIEKLFDAV